MALRRRLPAAIFPVDTGLASVQTMLLNGSTGRFAAVPVWWAVFRTAAPPLMLVCARLRHVAGTQWGNKKYMNMKHLEAAIEDASIAG